MGWIRRLRATFQRSPVDGAMFDEEARFHRDQRIADYMAAGMTPDAAERAADLRMGNLTLAREQTRDADTLPWLTDLGRDLRYAVRQLRRDRTFALPALLTLALGIGASTAMFALADNTLLRPLPFPAAERLVVVWERTPTSRRASVSVRNLQDWNERSHSFEGIAAFVPNVASMNMSAADGTTETIPRQWVSAGIFDVLGIKAVAGRTFLPSDVRERADVIVLSETFWRARFNADPGVVGRELRLDGQSHRVVGIVPDETQLIGRSSIWALAWNRYPLDAAMDARGSNFSHAIGRLKPGVTLEAATTDLDGVADRLARDYPDTNRGRGIAIERLDDVVIGTDLRQTSMLFLGVVGLVLLICSANVANLLLTRASGRRRELVVRSALGAGRSRVVRQLMTESVLLALVGGLLGLGVALVLLQVVPAMVPTGLLPAPVTLTLDLRVFAFGVGVALLVGGLVGLVPAWQASRFTVAQVLATDSRTTTRGGRTTRAALVIAQVATAVILLFGAGLLLRTLVAVTTVDPGYRADRVLTMIVDPPSWPQDQLLRFYDDVARDVVARPGVSHAGWATTLPLGRSYLGQSSFEIVGNPPAANDVRPTADLQIVSPGYFQTLDLPFVAGRGFTDRDTATSVPVCLVNEAFVRGPLQGRSPIGLQVALGTESSQEAPVLREIVGVVRQVKRRPDETEALLQIYVPLAQRTPGDIFLVVRPAGGSAEALVPSVRGVIREHDREQLVSVRNVMTLADVAGEATGRYRFRATLLLILAGLALLLAMVGVFGILAGVVQQRVREFGVRMALGASLTDVLGIVVKNALLLVSVGVVIGLAAAAMLSPLLASVLFNVQALDPFTFGAVILVLGATAAVATAAPAWRAARIDPVVALRSD